ncbi:MAG: trypsin-like serine protease [Alphaproteobacteria bacterium]|nr:trypsin-like serine protease [Alphaproteobacteria bacterium]
MSFFPVRGLGAARRIFAACGALAGFAVGAFGLATEPRAEPQPVPATSMPWAAIGRVNLAGTGHCSGALIGPKLVLTAAHCLYNAREGHWIAGVDTPALGRSASRQDADPEHASQLALGAGRSAGGGRWWPRRRRWTEGRSSAGAQGWPHPHDALARTGGPGARRPDWSTRQVWLLRRKGTARHSRVSATRASLVQGAGVGWRWPCSSPGSRWDWRSAARCSRVAVRPSMRPATPGTRSTATALSWPRRR